MASEEERPPPAYDENDPNPLQNDPNPPPGTLIPKPVANGDFNPFIILKDSVCLINKSQRPGCLNPAENIYHAFTLFIMLYNLGFRHFKLLYELARCYYGTHKTIAKRYRNPKLAIKLMRLSVQNPAGNDVDFWSPRSHLVEYLVNYPGQRTYEIAQEIIRVAIDYKDLTPKYSKKYQEKLHNVKLDLDSFIIQLWHPATEHPFTMTQDQKIEITKSVYQYFPEVPNAVAQINGGFKPFRGPVYVPPE